MEQKKEGILFDIGRFRTTDGPGIRTILFFKGCPLKCKWCSNPFGLSAKPQLSVNRERCTSCGRCVKACPQKANVLLETKIKVDFEACIQCGACVSSCLAQCRELTGTAYTVRELFEEVRKDAAFYRKHGGGVTLSGGEALLQHEVAIELLHLCKANYLNTCLETSAYTTWDILREAARYCDSIFVDLKHMDSQKHQELTGVPNETILENIRLLCAWSQGKPCRVILRIPVIPGYNEEEENLRKAAHFIRTLEGKPEVNLLPYHNLGEAKYAIIGRAYEPKIPMMLRKQDLVMTRAKEILEESLSGNPVSMGGENISLVQSDL